MITAIDIVSDYSKKIADFYKQQKINPMQVPRIVKITISSMSGRAVDDKLYLEEVKKWTSRITGQGVLITYIKNPEAAWKTKVGVPVGVKVDLRGKRALNFLFKCIYLYFPRIRSFRGFTPTFDGQGNLNIGIEDSLIFSEVKYNEAKFSFGLGITIVTSCKTDLEAFEFFKLINFPFNLKNVGKIKR